MALWSIGDNQVILSCEGFVFENNALLFRGASDRSDGSFNSTCLGIGITGLLSSGQLDCVLCGWPPTSRPAFEIWESVVCWRYTRL